MGRPLRIQFEGAWYHVMNRGASRQVIYKDNSDKLKFLNILEKVIKTYHIEIHAYCLMDNHYHLLVHTPYPNLSEAMRQLNSLHARQFNQRHHKDGPLFRSRYKAIIVGGEEYLLRLSRYIHRNPLEAKIVNKLEAYKWSSYSAYIEKSPSIEWLKMSVIKKRFSKRKLKASYQAFVENQTDEALKAFYNNNRFMPVFGSAGFIEKIIAFADSQSLSSEVVGKNQIQPLPTIEEIACFVARYYKVNLTQLRQPTYGKNAQARKVAMIICREEASCQLRMIGQFFGQRAASAVSKMISRTRANKEVMKEVIQIKARFLQIRRRKLERRYDP